MAKKTSKKPLDADDKPLSAALLARLKACNLGTARYVYVDLLATSINLAEIDQVLEAHRLSTAPRELIKINFECGDWDSFLEATVPWTVAEAEAACDEHEEVRRHQEEQRKAAQAERLREQESGSRSELQKLRRLAKKYPEVARKAIDILDE